MVKNTGSYVPDRGDIVWLDFSPTRGHEQHGRRPALVVSPKEYNQPSGLFIVCPITSKSKDYRFEVPILGKVSGVIQSDHVKSQDWTSRNCKFISRVNSDVLQRVSAFISILTQSD